MCGIAGSINSPLPVEHVLELLHHRGPDDCGQHREGQVHLLHTRLAIIDAPGGAQPMRRGPLTIAYNGEIYNHRELRERHSLDCRSGSDTETLLALYAKLGPDCLHELDGMFAFALHDTRSDSLWLARDRVGEKPLYVWTDNARRLVFASELNALAQLTDASVDDGALNDWLGTGLKAGSRTLFRQVQELEPGSWLMVDTKSLTLTHRRWFGIETLFSSPKPRIHDRQEALEAVDVALSKAVRRQMLASDLKVGAFLSGGIDSGLVVAKAAGEVGVLDTFTVAFEGQFDESPLARQVAERYGTRHQVLEVDYTSLPLEIEGIVANYGTPTADDSIVPVWYVSRAAREHVTVVLTGDGADEQFAGYRRYVPYARLPLFTSGGRSPAQPGQSDSVGEVSSRPGSGSFAPGMEGVDRADSGKVHALARQLLNALPAPRRKQSLYNYIHRLITLVSLNGLQRYLATTTMLDARLLRQPGHGEALSRRYEHLAASDHSHLARLMMMDFDTLLAGGLVTKMDIGAMAHSLEARSPFLSSEILQLAPRLSDSLKIDGRQTKSLLRSLAQRYLPTELCDAPKRGFETPLLDWVDGRLKPVIHDRLGAPNAQVLRYIERDRLQALLGGTLAGVTPVQRARFLWQLLTTEIWLQRHA